MNLNGSVIGISVIVFLLGYLIGLYEGRWKHKGEANKLRHECETIRHERQQALENLASLREEYEQLRSQPAPALSLHTEGQEIRLSLDGEALTPSSLTDAQHRRLLALLKALTPYVTRKPAATSKAPQRPTPPPAAASPAAAPPAAAPQPAPPASIPQTGSIVEQIDAILQTMLENTPLDNRGIRLQEGPDGSVVVWVGLSRYASVDEVPEEAIRRSIQAAIQAWENRL